MARARSSQFVIASIVVVLTCTIILTPCLLAKAANDSSSSTTTTSTSTASSPSNSHSTPHAKSIATQTRQSGVSAAASAIGAIGSLLPGLISNVAPLVVLFGLGALMMPSLGMSAMGLLREARRSGSDQPQANGALPTLQFPAAFAQYARPLQGSPQDIYYFTKRSLPGLMSNLNLNSGAIVAGLQDLADRVARAIDNADQRYN